MLAYPDEFMAAKPLVTREAFAFVDLEFAAPVTRDSMVPFRKVSGVSALFRALHRVSWSGR